MLRDNGLSTEIWLSIMMVLDQPSLKALTEVSKDLYALSAPILYSNIDLSIHNPPRSTTEDGRETAPIIFGRQNLFMQQLRARPELAVWVRSFTWTMGLHRICELPAWSQKEGKPSLILQRENIYTLYQSLRDVIRVDISGGDVHDYPYQSLPPLFPKASHIRLSGQMHYALASAILHGPRAPLKCLSLTNLLEAGCLRGGRNFQLQYDPRFKYRPRLLPVEEIWADDGNPVQVVPGEMTRLLGPALQSRCSRLHRFTFGILDLTSESGLRILPPGWCTRNAAIHDELTAFLYNVHPREVALVYSRLSAERRAELKSRYWRRRCVIHPRPSLGPQHGLFQTLLDGWPGLQKIVIHGGNRDSDFPNEPEQSFPSPADRPSLENVQVCFEPYNWDTYHGPIGTAGIMG
ncbi:hypothetical protein N7492_008021 [Penicillium capsulatum]|uniref:Uncharacterized protein n=1 Tax=Penicillium capsulatum TaxID=69766 RepID=A0A9W9LGI8_9EURO|nr:hypothetical protein N7492_008021 [Penicillium capsulatum]KAJ6105429.1 hypothetical protein N7512_008946 [Penicillium capsulatum]